MKAITDNEIKLITARIERYLKENRNLDGSIKISRFLLGGIVNSTQINFDFYNKENLNIEKEKDMKEP